MLLITIRMGIGLDSDVANYTPQNPINPPSYPTDP